MVLISYHHTSILEKIQNKHGTWKTNPELLNLQHYILKERTYDKMKI